MASTNKREWDHEWPAIELNNNQISDEGCEALAGLLRISKSVTQLHLSNNGITDHGIATLMEAVVASGRLLDTMLFANNQLSSKGAILLANAIGKMPVPNCIVLDISHNQMIGRKGVRALLDADVPIKFEGFRIVRGDADLDGSGSGSQASPADKKSDVAASSNNGHQPLDLKKKPIRVSGVVDDVIQAALAEAEAAKRASVSAASVAATVVTKSPRPTLLDLNTPRTELMSVEMELSCEPAISQLEASAVPDIPSDDDASVPATPTDH